MLGNDRILVTGGSGFLGSIYVSDCSAMAPRFTVRRQFLYGQAAQHRASAGPAALRTIAPRRYVSAPCRGRPLACPASPVHYQHDPVQTTKTSVIAAINMLGLAKRLKAKILQASFLAQLVRSGATSNSPDKLASSGNRSQVDLNVSAAGFEYDPAQSTPSLGRPYRAKRDARDYGLLGQFVNKTFSLP